MKNKPAPPTAIPTAPLKGKPITAPKYHRAIRQARERPTTPISTLPFHKPYIRKGGNN